MGRKRAVPYLAGGAVLVGAIAIVNLLLTVGVIRRLRQHTELISANQPQLAPDLMVGVGESPDDFSVLATDGQPVTRELLADGQLVGFFSPTCEPCKELAPRFVERAARVPADRARALAVVVGHPDEVGDMVTRFEPVARVVVEPGPEAGTVTNAFKVKGFPAVCTLDGTGTVVATGLDRDRRAEPSLAR
jgi:hypothetical protein